MTSLDVIFDGESAAMIILSGKMSYSNGGAKTIVKIQACHRYLTIIHTQIVNCYVNIVNCRFIPKFQNSISLFENMYFLLNNEINCTKHPE